MPRRKSDWVDATRPIPPTVAPLVRSVLAAVYPETSCIRIVSGLWLPLLLLRSCTHIRLCDKPLPLKHPVPHIVVAIAIKRAVYTVTVFCRVVLVYRFVNTANQRWQASDASIHLSRDGRRVTTPKILLAPRVLRPCAGFVVGSSCRPVRSQRRSKFIAMRRNTGSPLSVEAASMERKSIRTINHDTKNTKSEKALYIRLRACDIIHTGTRAHAHEHCVPLGWPRTCVSAGDPFMAAQSCVARRQGRRAALYNRQALYIL